MTPEELSELLAAPRHDTTLNERDEGEVLGMIIKLQEALGPEEFRAFVLGLARGDETNLRQHLPPDAPILKLLDDARDG